MIKMCMNYFSFFYLNLYLLDFKFVRICRNKSKEITKFYIIYSDECLFEFVRDKLFFILLLFL